MSARAVLTRLVTSLITSPARRDFIRAREALKRRMSGQTPTVFYFHQADDPYSALAAQMLAPLAARYAVEIKTWLVPPPDDAAAPERERLAAYARRDAVRLARAYGLDFPTNAPPPADAAPEAEGGPLRARLGHYLGAMFYFEGEWYWGVDRLNHLEERLAGLGLDRRPGAPPLAPYKAMRLGPRPAGPPVEIDLWFSFRSPYSWIVFRRIRRLAEHYGATLNLRYILPMVMRGLPVPREKSRYIVFDTKREADRAGEPFGRIIDPVGVGVERAIAVLHHAVALGKGADFAESTLRGSWAEGVDLTTDQGLLQVAQRAGLTAADVAAGLADPSWCETAEANRAALFEAGLWGAPTFRVPGRPAHWGQDRLWALEEDVLEAMASR